MTIVDARSRWASSAETDAPLISSFMKHLETFIYDTTMIGSHQQYILRTLPPLKKRRLRKQEDEAAAEDPPQPQPPTLTSELVKADDEEKLPGEFDSFTDIGLDTIATKLDHTNKSDLTCTEVGWLSSSQSSLPSPKINTPCFCTSYV